MKLNHAVKIRVSAITRGQGHKAVAAAAYRSGSRLVDEKYDCVHNYQAKSGEVAHSEIVVPDGNNIPDWLQNAEEHGGGEEAQTALRERVWNEAEKAEDTSTRRKQAVVGKSFVCILPRELNQEQNIALMQDFAEGMRTRGLLADWSLHMTDAADGQQNPHAHLAICTRSLDSTGFGKKWEPAGAEKGKKPKWAYLDDKKLLAAWRKEYTDAANRAYEAAGLDVRATEKGYEELGIDQKAEAHKGKDATALEKKGEKTRVESHNRKVGFDNILRPYDRALDNAPEQWAFQPPAAEESWHKKFAEWQLLRGGAMAARDAAQKQQSSVMPPPATRSLRYTEMVRQEAQLAARQNRTWQERVEKTPSQEPKRGR